MKIYKHEHAIASQLNNQAIAFLIEPTIVKPTDPDFAIANYETTETPDTPDLFYLKSILASSVWNKNSDVFIPSELWKARKTVVDKPTNVNHNEMKIVGHITSSWVINAGGDIIADDTDPADLPSLFHVCNSAVIYRFYRDKDLRNAAASLIEEIEAGKKFVSMECFFNDFDYGILNESTGVFQVVERNDETSFLTKHLACYGGEGCFDEYKLGRVVRDFVFNGKGYVDRPANPDSVIFDFKEKNSISFEKSEKDGVYIFCKANNEPELKMSEKNTDATVVADLQKQVCDLEAALALAKAEITKVNESLVASQEEVKVANLAIDAIKASEKMLTEKFEAIKAEHDSAVAELNTIKAGERKARRIQAFVDKGFAKDNAEAQVASLAEIDDQVFEKILAFVNVQPANSTMKIEEDTTASVKNVPEVPATDELSAMKSALASYLDEQVSEKGKRGN